MQKQKTSIKVDQFVESVIREMTRFATQYRFVNLAQEFPDFACPPELKTAACKAITADVINMRGGNCSKGEVVSGSRPRY